METPIETEQYQVVFFQSSNAAQDQRVSQIGMGGTEQQGSQASETLLGSLTGIS